MLSGGSPASWSATCAAKTVIVQVTPSGRSVVGSMVKVVGPPVTAASAGLTVRTVVAPALHTNWNQLPVTLTGSLKVTVTFVPGATPVALLVGVVEETDGGTSMVNEKT